MTEVFEKLKHRSDSIAIMVNITEPYNIFQLVSQKLQRHSAT